MKLGPKEIKVVNEYFVRPVKNRLKEIFLKKGLPQLKTPDEVQRPQRALDKEAIDAFMKRNPKAEGGPIELNSEFQKKVKNLLDQDLSNREVAEKLNRGVTTIKRVKDAIKYPSKKEAIAKQTVEKYTKLKKLVEEANKGSKLIYQKDLAKSVGIKSLDPNFAKMKKRFNVPDLDTPADKVQKEFLKTIKNPETPIEDTFSLVKKISEKTGVGASKTSEHLLKLPEYKNANKMLKTLSQVEFQKKIRGKGFTLGDFEEIIQQKKDAPKLQVSSISTPEKFIIDSAMRHQAAGGDKITFIKKPGDVDRQGNLITHRDAEFEFKGKRYSYFDLLKDGRKNKEFKDVYKVADDLNEFLGKEVIHPVTKEKVIFKNLMKEAYNKGAGYGYERAPYDIDHFKSVKKEPFKNLRVLPRRINTSQGIMMNLADTAQQGLLGKEAASKYTPEKTKAYSKKMGYDFNKNIDQLFKDELKLADDILVKGRVLKTPLDIAKQSFAKVKQAGGVELGANPFFSPGILKEAFKQLPTPAGAVGLNLGLGVDPRSSIDRASIAAEAAFAPALVKQAAKLGPVGQRIANLGLTPAMAARVARIASPLGIASLAAEGLYQGGKFTKKRMEELRSMTPEQRAELRRQGEAQAFDPFQAAGGGIAKLAGDRSGAMLTSMNPDKDGLQGPLNRGKKQ